MFDCIYFYDCSVYTYNWEKNLFLRKKDKKLQIKMKQSKKLK